MNKTIKLASLLIIPTLMVSLLSGCSKEEKKKGSKGEKISRTELFMGTAVKVTLYDNNDEKILDKAFDRVEEIENLVSINKLGTEVEKINENAGIKPVKVSEDSFNIIEKALDYSIKSQGGYDLTIGPLVKLWSIGLPEARVPEKTEIDQCLKLVNYQDVEINKEEKELYLKEKAMKIDLGSIAKGYTADEVVKVLKSEGVEKAIVDLGGNIFALGEKADNTPWNIGIQNPFVDRGEVVGTIGAKDKSIVTSGVYERYIEKDGVKYHHILNPETGYPYDSEIAGVSLITDKSIDGDALSTLIFTKGIKEGMEFVESMDSVEAIFISKDKKVYLTTGVKENFKLTNEDFEIVA